MKYLKSFNQLLIAQRRKKKLTQEDVAVICQVETQLVAAWESPHESQRAFPNADNLIDLCIKAGMRLEQLIDVDASQIDVRQLQLPGFADNEDKDLAKSLDELQEALENMLPDEQERELLRRYRNSDPDKQRFILQLIGP